MRRPAARRRHGIKRAQGKVKPPRLKPVTPSIAIEIAYRKKLSKLVDEMHASTVYWIRASYRANEAAIVSLAMDDVLPTNALKRAIARLRKRWLRAFAEAAPKLADFFATAANQRSDDVLAKILRDGGFSVRWQMTQAMKDVVQATTAENVGLIKSIPEKYLGQVEGMVMRSISAGRDMGTLAKGLQKEFGVTKNRAALIARDQNNKATANMSRVRSLELGIKQAIWRHSGAGKEKYRRPTHVKAGRDRIIYDIAKGWFDPHEKKWIQPGELIGCKCVGIPLIPGFS